MTHSLGQRRQPDQIIEGSTPPPNSGLSRRNFLLAGLATVGTAALASCKPQPVSAKTAPTTPTGKQTTPTPSHSETETTEPTVDIPDLTNMSFEQMSQQFLVAGNAPTPANTMNFGGKPGAFNLVDYDLDSDIVIYTTQMFDYKYNEETGGLEAVYHDGLNDISMATMRLA